MAEADRKHPYLREGKEKGRDEELKFLVPFWVLGSLSLVRARLGQVMADNRMMQPREVAGLLAVLDDVHKHILSGECGNGTDSST
jgi:hypothetical protein